MVALGMFLFLACDINVALFNITKFVPPTNEIIFKLQYTAFVLIWFFYLPSQILLSMSGYSYKKIFQSERLNYTKMNKSPI
jgi:hypothetical protein